MELLKEKIPFFILSIISSLVTIWAQDKGGSIITIDKLFFSERFSNAIVSYANYLGKIFLPANLSIFYPYQLVSSWQLLGSVLLLIIVTTGVLFFVRKAPFLITGWLWYLGTLIPVIGLVQVGKQAIADRYTYLPSIGILVMLVWGLLSLIPQEKTRKFFLAPLSGVAILIMVVLSWQYCLSWKNSITIFNHALGTTKNNYLAHNNLGVALAEKGNTQEAISHYRVAIAINPLYDSAIVNLGTLLAAAGKNEESVNYYLQAIKANPANAHAHTNLGAAFSAMGKKEEAEKHYRQALKIDQKHVDAFYNLANLLAEQGKRDEAAANYRQAIAINPGHSRAHYNYAELLVQTGNINQAIEHFREAARVDATSFKALNNLGVLLEKQQRHDEAIYYYQKALKLDPEHAGLHFNIGVALGNKGDLEKAAEHFQKALELNPQLTQARQALNIAREMQKKH